MATARKKAAAKSAGTARSASPATRTTPVAKAAAAALKPEKAAKAPKAAAKAKKAQAKPDGKANARDSTKDKKPKLVRDSFTIPKAEYAVLQALKDRAARLGRAAKKSEVLRAGVKSLESMTDAAFLASLGAVPAIKTGRPAKP